MPRETVPHAMDDGEFLIKVGWEREQYLQLGIEIPEEADGQHHLVDYFYGAVPTRTVVGRLAWEKMHEYVDARFPGTFKPIDFRSSDEEAEFFNGLGREVLDAVTGSGEGPATGLWWSPSRYQVNALIRLLRRARDAAFGKDE